jgi:hypothetical protein
MRLSRYDFTTRHVQAHASELTDQYVCLRSHRPRAHEGPDCPLCGHAAGDLSRLHDQGRQQSACATELIFGITPLRLAELS